MEVEIVSVIISGVVAVVAVLSLLLAFFKVWSETRERLAKVEAGLEGVKERINDLRDELIAFLAHRGGNPNGRREELLNKLKEDKLSREEAEELDRMLRKELEEAKARGDTATALAITLLLGFIKPLIRGSLKS